MSAPLKTEIISETLEALVMCSILISLVPHRLHQFSNYCGLLGTCTLVQAEKTSKVHRLRRFHNSDMGSCSHFCRRGLSLFIYLPVCQVGALSN